MTASKERWQDPEYRERVSKKIKEASNTPEQKKMRSERAKALWADPDYRAARCAEAKERWKNPEYRAKRGWKPLGDTTTPEKDPILAFIKKHDKK